MMELGICTAGSYLRLNFVYKILSLKTCIILLKNNKIINSYIKLSTVQIPRWNIYQSKIISNQQCNPL